MGMPLKNSKVRVVVAAGEPGANVPAASLTVMVTVDVDMPSASSTVGVAVTTMLPDPDGVVDVTTTETLFEDPPAMVAVMTAVPDLIGVNTVATTPLASDVSVVGEQLP